MIAIERRIRRLSLRIIAYLSLWPVVVGAHVLLFALIYWPVYRGGAAATRWEMTSVMFVRNFDTSGLLYLALVGLTIAIVHFLPRVTKTVPSSLVASLVVTALAIDLRLDIQSVGDLGTIARSLPAFALPAVPLSFETLLIILPYSATLMVVGLLESLLTASIVEEMTGTRSGRGREVRGQGLANCVAGLFGGMAGSRLSWPGSF